MTAPASSRALVLGNLTAAVFAFFVSASPAFCAEQDPSDLLREAQRQIRVGDTPSALRHLRACVMQVHVREGILEEAIKTFVAHFRSPSDSASALAFFSAAVRAPAAAGMAPAMAVFLKDYPWLSNEEKLSVLSEFKNTGRENVEILEIQIQLLRQMGRHASAIELAARLAQMTSRLDHRALVVDLLLDLSRNSDAVSLGNSILSDAVADPSVYSMLAEKFYRHGDYRNALELHNRARLTFSNPTLFFDQSLSICQGLQLGREGIELYLPLLLENSTAAPEYFRDFIGMISDTEYLIRDYLGKISQGRNPNLFTVALFRIAETVPDSDCLSFVRFFRGKFRQPSAHLALAEHLLDRGRQAVFQSVLADLPDTPPEVMEAKTLLLFKNVLRAEGPDKALARYPAASFSATANRASMQREASRAFLEQSRLPDAIFWLKSAQELAPEAMDHLRLVRMYFLAGSDSEALSAAYKAHESAPTEETLYWLGWLSYLKRDTETARRAFRDVASRSENFLSDEALTWLVAMSPAAAVDPQEIGRAARDSARRRSAAPDKDFPVAVRITLMREAMHSGGNPDWGVADGSAFIQYMLWESADAAEKTEGRYQKMLKDAPEYLRALIRTEAP